MGTSIFHFPTTDSTDPAVFVAAAAAAHYLAYLPADFMFVVRLGNGLARSLARPPSCLLPSVYARKTWKASPRSLDSCHSLTHSPRRFFSRLLSVVFAPFPSLPQKQLDNKPTFMPKEASYRPTDLT